MPPPAAGHEPDAQTHPTAGAELPVGVPLLLGTHTLALKARAHFRCQMLAEPADQVEFTWYLNNSHNERKVLSSGAPHEQATTMGDSGAAHSAARVASSQLSYQIESGLDYGQLYCMARNAIGDQKRACVYSVEQSGECI